MPKRPISEIISCLSGYDPEAVPVEQAQQIIHDFIMPINATEHVPLRGALDRVLASDIVSPINVPAHDNAAMDGYAFRGSDLRNDGPTHLELVGEILAGGAPFRKIGPGECVRIMTGAVLPDSCDTVVPQEFILSNAGQYIDIPDGILSLGDNRRSKGEDLEIGKIALHRGRILRPADLGLIASLGIAEVLVQKRLRVAFFSTGNELRSIGQSLDDGSVYDSNRYTLYGMLTRLGCETIDMGVVSDDPSLMEAAFCKACENADAIITTGGVSVGAADYTKEVMRKLGDMHFWKIGMRPGRPMAFGSINSHEKAAVLFGLPGNPVAVMVTFYFFVRDALLRMMGASPKPLPLIKVKSLSPIRKKAGRTEYQRGILSRNDMGELQVSITGSQGSGVLRSMSEADCMIVLGHQQSGVTSGEMVDVLLFDGLV